jgi:hypothetical protein
MTHEAAGYLDIRWGLGTAITNLKMQLGTAVAILQGGKPPEVWRVAAHALGVHPRDEDEFRTLTGKPISLMVPIPRIEAAIGETLALQSALQSLKQSAPPAHVTPPTPALPPSPPLWVWLVDLPHWLFQMYGLEGAAPFRYVVLVLRREPQHYLSLLDEHDRLVTVPADFWGMLSPDEVSWDTYQVFLPRRRGVAPMPCRIVGWWGAVADAVTRWRQQQARKAAFAAQAMTTKAAEPEPAAPSVTAAPLLLQVAELPEPEKPAIAPVQSTELASVTTGDEVEQAQVSPTVAVIPHPRRNFAVPDAPLIAVMHRRLTRKQKPAKNVTDAARLVVKMAQGAGTQDSKVKRLVARYRQLHPHGTAD